MTERTAREKLHAWIENKIRDAGSFKISDLADDAVAELGADSRFYKAFTREFFRQAIADEIREYTRMGRDKLAKIGSLHFDPERMDEAGDSIVDKIWGRWHRVYENVDGRQLRVLDMKKDDLTAAIANRNKHADAHAKWAQFFGELRKSVGSNAVRDRFSAEELDGVWERISDWGKSHTMEAV